MVLLHMIKNGMPIASPLCLRFWRRDDKNQIDQVGQTEEELRRLELNIARLLQKLNESADELPLSVDEECVVCSSGRSGIQTFPCGHTVVCRKCFIRTIQVALAERNFPLRCVVCRCPISRLKQQICVRRVTVRPQKSFAPIVISSTPTAQLHLWTGEGDSGPYSPGLSPTESSSSDAPLTTCFSAISAWFQRRRRRQRH